MTRVFLVCALLSALSLPTYAAPHNSRHATSCSDLWTAVIATLRTGNNYSAIAIDEEDMKVNFIVIGALFSTMNSAELKPHESGCQLQVRMGFTGNTDDEWAFRRRVHHSLERQQAAKPATPARPAHAEPGPAE